LPNLETAPPPPPAAGTLSRQQIDHWQVRTAGFNTRATHCLERAGFNTIGQLRDRRDQELLRIRNFGRGSLRNVRWFFNWVERLENGAGECPDLPAVLREFLGRAGRTVIEQRFGLTDPLFRPLMKRATLDSIGRDLGGLTRERIRQVESNALRVLRSRLCGALLQPLAQHWRTRLGEAGGAVSFAELGGWSPDPSLGGYNPWGSLLLLGALSGQIGAAYDFFACHPTARLREMDAQLARVLRQARRPVSLAETRAALATTSPLEPRLVALMLDRHPDVSETLTGEYFDHHAGAGPLLADILHQHSPLPLTALAAHYNARVKPPSRVPAPALAARLRHYPEVQRVGAGMYRARPRG
jgi:hypothetical protein